MPYCGGGEARQIFYSATVGHVVCQWNKERILSCIRGNLMASTVNIEYTKYKDYWRVQKYCWCDKKYFYEIVLSVPTKLSVFDIFGY